jgi:hypothetical protein
VDVDEVHDDLVEDADLSSRVRRSDLTSSVRALEGEAREELTVGTREVLLLYVRGGGSGQTPHRSQVRSVCWAGLKVLVTELNPVISS